MLKESTLSPGAAIYRHVIPAGDYWMHTVEKGQFFRIVDLEGNQAADTLFFSAADPAERYSAVDTIRACGNVYPGFGTKLMSTESNVMLEIVADTRPRFAGLEFGLTGMPVLETDEMSAAEKDTKTASWLAIATA